MITPIQNLSTLPALERAGAAALMGESPSAQNAQEKDSVFAGMFQTLIDQVKDTDAVKVQAQYLLATGQLDNPAALSIASSKNQIAVDMLIQLRNKSLDAYSELMRISL